MAEAAPAQAEVLEWPKKDRHPLLHAVYGVGDLERLIKECFGMKLLTKMDIPEEKYASAFLGFGPEESHFVVEWTYGACESVLSGRGTVSSIILGVLDYGVSSYDIGTGFGHSAIATRDVYKMVTHNFSNMEISEKIDDVTFMIRGTIGTSVQSGWWLDSGATVHGCNNKSLMKNFQEEVDPEFLEVRLADGSIAKTEGQGSVELEFTMGKKILLPNVLYVPQLNKNLISVYLLDEMGLWMAFGSKMVHLWMNGTWMGMGFAKNGMYQLSIN